MSLAGRILPPDEVDRLADLEEQYDRLVRALSFYADLDNWMPSGKQPGRALYDVGELARKTLLEVGL